MAGCALGAAGLLLWASVLHWGSRGGPDPPPSTHPVPMGRPGPAAPPALKTSPERRLFTLVFSPSPLKSLFFFHPKTSTAAASPRSRSGGGGGGAARPTAGRCASGRTYRNSARMGRGAPAVGFVCRRRIWRALTPLGSAHTWSGLNPFSLSSPPPPTPPPHTPSHPRPRSALSPPPTPHTHTQICAAPNPKSQSEGWADGTGGASMWGWGVQVCVTPLLSYGGRTASPERCWGGYSPQKVLGRWGGYLPHKDGLGGGYFLQKLLSRGCFSHKDTEGGGFYPKMVVRGGIFPHKSGEDGIFPHKDPDGGGFFPQKDDAEGAVPP